MGEVFRAGLREVAAAHPGAVADVRGLGLMNALELSPEAPAAAWDVCLDMRDRGLLARPTKEHILRFTPPSRHRPRRRRPLPGYRRRQPPGAPWLSARAPGCTPPPHPAIKNEPPAARQACHVPR